MAIKKKTKRTKKLSWGSDDEFDKVTFRIKETTANRIRSAAIDKGLSQSKLVDEILTKIVHESKPKYKNIKPVLKRKTN